MSNKSKPFRALNFMSMIHTSVKRGTRQQSRNRRPLICIQCWVRTTIGRSTESFAYNPIRHDNGFERDAFEANHRSVTNHMIRTWLRTHHTNEFVKFIFSEEWIWRIKTCWPVIHYVKFPNIISIQTENMFVCIFLFGQQYSNLEMWLIRTSSTGNLFKYAYYLWFRAPKRFSVASTCQKLSCGFYFNVNLTA